MIEVHHTLAVFFVVVIFVLCVCVYVRTTLWYVLRIVKLYTWRRDASMQQQLHHLNRILNIVQARQR